MTNRKSLAVLTREAAAFAFREYFRPITVALRLPNRGPDRQGTVDAETPHDLSLAAAKAMLRGRLAASRHHERIQLLLCVVSVCGCLIAATVSLVSQYDALVTALVIVPAAALAAWATVQVLRDRAEIVELKTIRWMLKQLDEETAAKIAMQIEFGKRPGDRPKSSPAPTTEPVEPPPSLSPHPR